MSFCACVRLCAHDKYTKNQTHGLSSLGCTVMTQKKPQWNNNNLPQPLHFLKLRWDVLFHCCLFLQSIFLSLLTIDKSRLIHSGKAFIFKAAEPGVLRQVKQHSSVSVQSVDHLTWCHLTYCTQTYTSICVPIIQWIKSKLIYMYGNINE